MAANREYIEDIGGVADGIEPKSVRKTSMY
jgi:hypothetical protein